MAEAYPVELRQRVVGAYLAGQGTNAEIAALFKVGTATVTRWVSQHRREGCMKPPWVRFPQMDGWDIGWRMGGGEEYLAKYTDWLYSLDVRERRREIVAVRPIPEEWQELMTLIFIAPQTGGHVDAYEAGLSWIQTGTGPESEPDSLFPSEYFQELD